MEFYRKKYQLPMLYLIGFGTGILYANFIAKNYITMTGIFHEYFLNQYTQVKIINEDYLWYLLRWRVMPLALAVCVAKSGISQTDSSWNPPLDRLCSRDTVCGGSFKDGTLRNAAVYCRYFPAIYFLCTGISSIDPVLLSLSAK